MSVRFRTLNVAHSLTQTHTPTLKFRNSQLFLLLAILLAVYALALPSLVPEAAQSGRRRGLFVVPIINLPCFQATKNWYTYIKDNIYVCLYVCVARNKYKCLLSVCRLLAPTSSFIPPFSLSFFFTLLPPFIFLPLFSFPSPNKHCFLPSLGSVKECNPRIYFNASTLVL